MKKFRKIAYALVIVLIPGLIFASNNTIKVGENDNVSLVMSTKDVNRVIVKNDTIASMSGPKNNFLITKDADAVDIRIGSGKPFMSFITTSKGIHLSALIIPNEKTLGRSYILDTTGVVGQEVYKVSDYQSRLMALMTAMISRNTPLGFTASRPSKPENITYKFDQGKIKADLVNTISDSVLTGYVYKIKNIDSFHTLRLSESSFYDADIRSISLKDQSLKPGQESMLYIIKSKGARK